MRYPLLAEVVDIARYGAAATDGSRLLRTRSFALSYSDGDASLPAESEDEYFLLLPDVGAQLQWVGGVVQAPPHSVVIMPAGSTIVRPTEAGVCARLFAKLPAQLGSIPIFGQHEGGAAQLRDVLPYTRRSPSAGPVIHVLDALPNSPGMPRAKLFQTQTMSINWVEYSGPRDRKNLSPHAHSHFEQASLALAGDFVHHLRVPWDKDADSWQQDQHLAAGPGTVALVPPGIVHTTEGVGAGLHILIDIFAPPRDDFIAKGQVLNAAAYAAPADIERWLNWE